MKEVPILRQLLASSNEAQLMFAAGFCYGLSDGVRPGFTDQEKEMLALAAATLLEHCEARKRGDAKV